MGKVELKIVHATCESENSTGGEGNCGGGTCPTLYIGNDGNYYIQGFIVEKSVKDGIDIPSGEDLLMISKELINKIKD